MRFKNIMQPAITCLLLLNGPVFGDEVLLDTPEASIEEHVPVGGRQKDSSKREEMKNRRAEESGETQMNDTLEAHQMLRRVSNRLNAAASPFMLASRRMARPQLCHAPASYPISCHWLISMADTGRSVEIEDGSHWDVAPTDTYILRSWRRNDPLVITPNSGWFSSYDYYITNKSNNSYVKANLTVGPTQHGTYSHWMVNIDYYGGHIYLENQMVWCVDPHDSYIMKDWAIGDHIIIGTYNSWFSPYDHILINVNMDHNVRVKQY